MISLGKDTYNKIEKTLQVNLYVHKLSDMHEKHKSNEHFETL